MLEKILGCTESNLFDFILHSLGACCQHLGITTPIRRSSGIAIDHALKSQEKVLAICQATGARRTSMRLAARTVSARTFLSGHRAAVPQVAPAAVSAVRRAVRARLSIIDVLMFNSPAAAQQVIHRPTISFAQRRVVAPVMFPARFAYQENAGAQIRIVLSQLVAALKIFGETISVCSSLSHWKLASALKKTPERWMTVSPAATASRSSVSSE